MFGLHYTPNNWQLQSLGHCFGKQEEFELPWRFQKAFLFRFWHTGFSYFFRNQQLILHFPAAHFGFSGFRWLYSLPVKGYVPHWICQCRNGKRVCKTWVLQIFCALSFSILTSRICLSCVIRPTRTQQQGAKHTCGEAYQLIFYMHHFPLQRQHLKLSFWPGVCEDTCYDADKLKEEHRCCS